MTTTDEVRAVIDRADYIANADGWRGDRAADVQAHLLRAIALGIVALTDQLAQGVLAVGRP